MALATLDGLLGSARQQLCISKTVSRSAAAWCSVLDVAGNPGAGTLSAGNTAAGVVPTSATAGFPPIAAFAGSATGYLMQVNAGNSSIPCRMKLFDLLFRCGAYAYNNGTTTLASQPSFSARLPAGNYSNAQIWLECVTAITGTPTVTVTYTNGAGTTGRSTSGQTLLSGAAVGRMVQMPLQSGDASVSKIESVASTGGSAGTFNVLVLRPLWSGGVPMANGRAMYDLTRTGLPVVYADSALYLAVASSNAITGFPDVDFVIASA